MISDLTAFLGELAENNTKEWFDKQRVRYEALRKQFETVVGEVIIGISAFDTEILHVQPKDAMFRINRDVRFAKDKSPYKTTFSAAFNPHGKNSDMAAYYFEINHYGELSLGGGMYMPEAENLSRLRENIAAHPEQIEAVLADKDFELSYGDLDRSTSLVNLPRGYDTDVPHADLIRLKTFFAARTMHLQSDYEDTTALAAVIVKHYQALYPLITWLRSVAKP
jgi:uncharacterized protein (TIGR02453 family)